MRKLALLFLICGGLAFLGATLHKNLLPTEGATYPVTFRIEENESIKDLSQKLFEAHLVSSPRVFRIALSWYEVDHRVTAGKYIIKESLPLLSLVSRITSGKPDEPLYRVTIPEGATLDEVGTLFAKEKDDFRKDIFIRQVKERGVQGFLFPETYYLKGTESESVIIDKMLSEFISVYNKSFDESISLSDLTSKEKLRNEVILASILEGEARGEVDMKMVAGILLKRLSIGMPLQVDVAKETYKSKSLPASPLSQPGLTALTAVKSPTTSKYLYYITGNDRLMHYSVTFDEHKANIVKYLKQ